MSHYSDDYDFQAEKRLKEFRKACKNSQKLLQEFLTTLPHDTPTRFKDHLEDLDNWLSCQQNLS